MNAHARPPVATAPLPQLDRREAVQRKRVLTGMEQLSRFEALPARMLDKVLWAKAQALVIAERGPRPVMQAHRLAPTEFPSLASCALANAELDVLSAALAWDRAKRETHKRLALAEGYAVTDHGLVAVGGVS